MSSAFTTCLAHPLDCISSVFGPGCDSTGTCFTTLGKVEGDTVGQAAVRAEGIDPGSLTLIAPQYGPGLTAQGVDVNNPSSIRTFANQVSNEAATLFQKGYEQNLAEKPLFPSFNFPDFSTPSGAFAGGIVILFFVFIFLWLVSR